MYQNIILQSNYLLTPQLVIQSLSDHVQRGRQNLTTKSLLDYPKEKKDSFEYDN